MKNSFYLLLFLTLFIAISCSSYRYITKNYDAIYNYNEKENNYYVEFKYKIIDTINKDLILIKYFSKDSILILSYYQNSDSKIVGEEKVFYLNGKIKSIKNYDKKGDLNGECKIYYENGNIKQIYNNKSANIDGIFQSFYENGNKKRVDYFSNGDFDSGTCWDINGNIVKHFDLEKNPEVNIQLISKSLIYPDILRRAGIEEKVIIKILIGTNSELIKFKYDKNHSKEFINEIIRVLNKPNKLKTAYYEDEPIECWFDLPINFRLK